jgi:hypothetical protein
MRGISLLSQKCQFLNHSDLWSYIVAYFYIMLYLTLKTFSLFPLEGQNHNTFYLLNK